MNKKVARPGGCRTSIEWHKRMWKRWSDRKVSRTIAPCAGGKCLIILTAVLLPATAAVYAEPARPRVTCGGDAEGATGTQTPEGRAGPDEQPCVALTAEQTEETPDNGANEQSATP